MPQIIVPLVAAAITAAIPAAGAVAFATVTYATIASTVLVTGALFGAALALAPRRRQQGTLPQLPPAQTMMSRASPVAHRFYGFGLVSDGGDLTFLELENDWLGHAIVIDCGRIDGLQAAYCDNELLPLTTGPAPYVFGVPVQYMSTVDFGSSVQWPNAGIKYAQRWSYIYYSGNIQQIPLGQAPAIFLEFRNATDAGTPSTLLREFFGDHPLNVRPDYRPTVVNWGAAHKAQGLSVVYAVATKFNLQDRLAVYPEAFPKWRFLRRAALAYDPRDPTQSFADPATWKWSRNPAIGRAWHMTHEAGFRRAYDEIDWTSIAAAADYCDRPVPKYGGGTEPYALCDMQFNTSMERREVEDIFDIACDGAGYEDEYGRFAYWIYQPTTPTVTLTMRDISSITEEHVGGPYSANTKFVSVYIEPRMNFQKNSAPAVVDDEAYAAIGDYTASLTHDGVPSFTQGFRLAHRTKRRVNAKRKLTLVGGWTFLRARRQRVVYLDCPNEGVVGVFWLQGTLKFSQKLNRFVMTVIELHSDAFDDVVPPRDPINDTIAVPVVSNTPIDAPAAPLLAADYRASGAFVQASIVAPSDTTLIAHFRVRRQTTPESPWIIMSDVLGQWAREFGPAAFGTYEVQAWLGSPYGTTSEYSPASTIDIDGALTFDNAEPTFDWNVVTWDHS